MKLRLQKDLVVMRLNDADLEQLEKKGFIREEIIIDGAVLSYELKLFDSDSVSMKLKNNQIEVFFPRKNIMIWQTSSKVGYHYRIGSTELIIEKDLKKKRK